MDARTLFLALLLAAALPAWGEPIPVSPTVCGAVLDSNGLPVEGARIELVRGGAGCTAAESGPPRTEAEEGLYRSTTGQDGRFGLLSLPPGRFDLRIEGEGFAPLERTDVEIPAGAGLRDLGRFVVERGAVQAGRVVDPDGQPLVGAEIHVGSRSQGEPAAVSGPGGYFTLASLPREGGVGLAVCCEGFLTAAQTIRELSPEPLDIVLEPAVRIAGRVFDPAGAPVAGAQVRAWLSGARPDQPVSLRPCRFLDTTAETDAEGRFVLEALPPGWWSLRAEASGWLSAETECGQILAGTGEAEVQIVLGEGAVVSGRVLAPDGTPLAGAEVCADGELSSPRTTTACDGTYHLAGVEPGERVVEATHPEHELAGRLLEVSSGENRLDLQLGTER